MKKLVLIGVLLMIVATIFVFGSSFDAKETPASDAKKQEMTALAKNRFNEQKKSGLDMSKGPCLGLIATGWVADVAHNPRQNIDDEPANQCADYRSGKIKHFVELDINGNLIKAQ